MFAAHLRCQQQKQQRQRKEAAQCRRLKVGGDKATHGHLKWEGDEDSIGYAAIDYGPVRRQEAGLDLFGVELSGFDAVAPESDVQDEALEDAEKSNCER